MLFGFGADGDECRFLLIVEWPSGLVTTQTGVATDQLFDSHRADVAVCADGSRRPARWNGFSASWGDYDGDGDLDLHVANYGQVDSLYRNDAGVMTPVAVTTMTTGVSNSYGSAWGDYDGDGDLDLSVGIAASGAQPTFCGATMGGGAFAQRRPSDGGWALC